MHFIRFLSYVVVEIIEDSGVQIEVVKIIIIELSGRIFIAVENIEVVAGLDLGAVKVVCFQRKDGAGAGPVFEVIQIGVDLGDVFFCYLQKIGTVGKNTFGYFVSIFGIVRIVLKTAAGIEFLVGIIG